MVVRASNSVALPGAEGAVVSGLGQRASNLWLGIKQEVADQGDRGNQCGYFCNEISNDACLVLAYKPSMPLAVPMIEQETLCFL
jgi:hypothetical protein